MVELATVPSPLLSIVIATLDRHGQLFDLLRSIGEQGVTSLEVIVVDQAEARSVPSLLESFGAGFPIRYVHSDQKNASVGRNLGARLARGTWLFFPDDDAQLLPETLTNAVAFLCDSLDLVTGRIVDESGRAHIISWLDHPAAITPHTMEQTFVESSFFIRRKLFLRCGGFDPLFGPGAVFPSAEGADLLRRLWQCGSFRSLYTPAIAIYHPAKGQEPSAASCARIGAHALGEGAYTARHLRVLQLGRLVRRLVCRTIASCVSRGYNRRRRIVYLRSFLQGLTQYRSSYAQLSAARVAIRERRDCV